MTMNWAWKIASDSGFPNVFGLQAPSLLSLPGRAMSLGVVRRGERYKLDLVPFPNLSTSFTQLSDGEHWKTEGASMEPRFETVVGTGSRSCLRRQVSPSGSHQGPLLHESLRAGQGRARATSLFTHQSRRGDLVTALIFDSNKPLKFPHLQRWLSGSLGWSGVPCTEGSWV